MANARSANISVIGKLTNDTAVWIVTIAAIAGASPPICLASVYAPAELGTAPKIIATIAACERQRFFTC